MYREEVITKSLREHKDTLGNELLKVRNRQKELLVQLEEHQLAIKTLDTIVQGMGRDRVQPAQVPVQSAPSTLTPPVAPGQTATEAQQPERPVQTFVRPVERKGMGRERLKAVAFPFMRARFAEEPFEVSRVRDLLDEMEPDVSHTYEVAWNLCNDLLREGKLRQAGQRRLPKGIVRLFMLKTATSNNRPAAQPASEQLAEGQ